MPDSSAEILWDTWGVPHVYASSDADAFRALGRAQVRAHGDLLLRLYGVARGRAAEYFGEKYLESDKFVRRFGLPERAARWAARQDPEMAANLTAFAEGVNAGAAAHPEGLSEEVRAVLPVSVEDVFAHIQRVYLVYLTTGGQRPVPAPYNEVLPPTTLLPDATPMGTGIAGSNAWAVSGSRTRSGRPMLLANPHLYWGDSHTFFEVHLNVTRPDGEDFTLYGVAQVGWPVLRYGFNARLGWAHTVNTLKGWDVFALEERDGGYVLDGTVRPFEVRHETLRVRGEDGGLREETFEVRRSVHGPVIAVRDGVSLAARCVGLDVAPIDGLFAQYWRMGGARTKAEFEAALALHRNAMFNVLYADRDGHIAYTFAGLVPKRPGGTWDDWAGTLPGNDSRLVWTEVHPWEDLPRVTDPEMGAVQNSNNPPWHCTLPPALHPDDFPAYLAPRFITPREQRALKMVGALHDATLDDLVACANDTGSETAERLVPPLLAAVEALGGETARRAAAVLAAWDRRYAPDSVGADLFARWLVLLAPDRALANVTAEPWSPAEPVDTPRGLADPALAVRLLEVAANTLEREAGTLERRWGDVVRVRRGGLTERGHGHLDPFGVFRVSGFARAADGRYEMAFGTTYVAAVEFNDPPTAKVLLAYGNSSRPGSPHAGDQLPLFARGQMRDALLTRDAVEAALEERETV